jgi:hypothetical protein
MSNEGKLESASLLHEVARSGQDLRAAEERCQLALHEFQRDSQASTAAENLRTATQEYAHAVQSYSAAERAWLDFKEFRKKLEAR